MNIPVTEWFPAEVKPTIPGYYQREYPSFEIDEDYQWPDYYDGESWFICPVDTNAKVKAPAEFRWRGLTSPHPEGKP